jgi:hypothetical protein
MTLSSMNQVPPDLFLYTGCICSCSFISFPTLYSDIPSPSSSGFILCMGTLAPHSYMNDSCCNIIMAISSYCDLVDINLASGIIMGMIINSCCNIMTVTSCSNLVDMNLPPGIIMYLTTVINFLIIRSLDSFCIIFLLNFTRFGDSCFYSPTFVLDLYNSCLTICRLHLSAPIMNSFFIHGLD